MHEPQPSPFGDPELVDIVVRSPERENGVDLLLLERPGEWSDADRADSLARKLDGYQSFVFRGQVARHVPGASAADVRIRVLLLRPLTAEMAEIDSAGPEGVAAVVFEDQDAFRAALNKGGSSAYPNLAPPNSARRPWWKVW
jgi:hypothetical protein